ncbi:MAG: hypothetical protein ACI9ZH_000035 [Paracoccaceae bacterium]|jgi:hypothetical protein
MRRVKAVYARASPAGLARAAAVVESVRGDEIRTHPASP